MRDLTSTADVYRVFGAMLRFAASAPACQPFLRQIDQTWQWSLTDPDAQLTCRFPASGPIGVDIGKSSSSVDTVIRMRTSDASACLLGELNVFLALDQGTTVIEGSPLEFLRTLPRLRNFISPIYREVLQSDTGLDLITSGLRRDKP